MNYDRNVPAKVKTLIYQTVVGPTFVTAAKHGHCERERERERGGGREGERGRERECYTEKRTLTPHARTNRERESI